MAHVYSRLGALRAPGAGTSSTQNNQQGYIAPDGKAYNSQDEYYKQLLMGVA
jgi:hypothetical protein